MSLLLIVILIGLIPAKIASDKGRSFVGWWFYGSALFIIALPHSLMISPDAKALEQQQLAEGLKQCRHCAELIKSDANVCRYCGRDLVAAQA
jgi:hypothetical protein